MWNSLLDNAKKVAEKAKEAAETIEGQLNDSVGAPQGGIEQSLSFTTKQNGMTSNGNDGIIDEDDCFDNAFDDEEEEEHNHDMYGSRDVANVSQIENVVAEPEEESGLGSSENDLLKADGSTEQSSKESQEQIPTPIDSFGMAEGRFSSNDIPVSEDLDSSDQDLDEKPNLSQVTPNPSSTMNGSLDCADESELPEDDMNEDGWDDDENLTIEETFDDMDVDVEVDANTDTNRMEQSTANETETDPPPEENKSEDIVPDNDVNITSDEVGSIREHAAEKVDSEEPIVTDVECEEAETTESIDEEVQNDKQDDEDKHMDMELPNNPVNSSPTENEGLESTLSQTDASSATSEGDTKIHSRKETICPRSIDSDEAFLQPSKVTPSNNTDDEISTHDNDMTNDTDEANIANTISEEVIQNENDSSIKEAVTTCIDQEVTDSIIKMKEEHNAVISILQSQVEDLQMQLTQREDQLASKSDQIAQMMEIHEKEKEGLKVKIKDTKDEAKKRLSKAKERVDEMQARLLESNSRVENADNSKEEQEGIIDALRKEGEKLALKQSEMETRVREARSEIRDLQDELEDEKEHKRIALLRIDELETKLKAGKEELDLARKVESRADQLDSDLLDAKEEREKNISTILNLENELKDAKSMNAKLKKSMESEMDEKDAKYKSHCLKIQKERDDLIEDLEAKLRTSEREANMREDSLRHEVGELRKRWQESVRRADALSIDLQQSSAPLMRQLDSAERQHRSRAAAWAELETKMRSEIEEQVVLNEKLSKENSSLITHSSKLRRAVRDVEEELKTARLQIDDANANNADIMRQHEETKAKLEEEKQKQSNLMKSMQDENNSARNEMLEGLRDSEQRYNAHLKSLERQLEEEHEKCLDLQKEIEEMKQDKTREEESIPTRLTQSEVSSSQLNKKLVTKANQVDILQSTILGLDDDSDVSESSQSWENAEDVFSEEKENGSFAYFEKLSQNLKAIKEENDTLRKQLDESESKRKSQISDLASSKDATERLPQLVSQVETLTYELREKEFEIEGLKDDIMEVRKIYRSQIETLVNENSSTKQSSVTTDDKKGKATVAVDELASGFGFM